MGLYNAVLIPPADLSAPMVAFAQTHFKDVADGYCLSDSVFPHVTLCQFETKTVPPRFYGFLGFDEPFNIELSGYGAHYGTGMHEGYTWVELLVHKTGALAAFQQAIANHLSGHNIKPMSQIDDYYRPHVTFTRVRNEDYKTLPNFVPPEAFFKGTYPWRFVCGRSDKNGQFLGAL